jgi:hypothetical protein
VCDYAPINLFHNPDVRGLIAGSLRAQPVFDASGKLVAVSAGALRGYCSHTHRVLAEVGELRAGSAIANELAHHPDLADGNEVVT